MKYTIFGNCVLHPNTNNPDHLKYNWGAYFDNKHKGNIRWYMSYEQSNLQLAVQVMTFMLVKIPIRYLRAMIVKAEICSTVAAHFSFSLEVG